MPEIVGTLKVPRLATAPSSPVMGQMYYNTTDNTLYWWDGAAWKAATGGGGADLVYNGSYPTNTPYQDGDIVVHNGVPYLCVRATSAEPTPWAVTGAGIQGPPGPEGPQGDQGIQGPQGDTGAQGTPGEKWFTGSGAPAGGTGIVGDWSLDSANGDYYEKTGTSAWTLRGNLRGPTGNTGIQGPEGPQGDPGTGIAVGTTAPASPSVNDLWVDTT